VKFLNDNFKELEKEMDVNDSNKIATLHDDNLKTSKKENKLNIYVIGTGGAGNNTITRLNQIGIDDVTTIAITTDAQDLYYCQTDEKILLEYNNRGVSIHPLSLDEVEDIVNNNENLIKEKLKNADLVFITCGLGGGLGTGSAPIISKIAKDVGALTIAVVTLPLYSEGFTRRVNAEKGLEKLKNYADTVIVIPNDKLLEVAPNLTISHVFMVIYEIIVLTILSMTRLITTPTLVPLSFEEFRNFFQDSGMAMMGMGESDSKERALESAQEALNSPLLDLDVSTTKDAFIIISTSSDINLYEAEKIILAIDDKLNSKANITWGVYFDDSLENTIRTTIIATGIKHHPIFIDEDIDDSENNQEHITPNPLKDIEVWDWTILMKIK